jgi:hypothetical protein
VSIQTINTELMLLSWRESSSGGASVTFALPDAESMEAFKALTTAKGGKGGQRFIAAFALLNDDETPAELPPSVSARSHPIPSDSPALPLGPRAKLAVQLCKLPAFTEWLRPRYDRWMGGYGDSWGDVHPEVFGGTTEKARNEAWTRHAILAICGCQESRRELDQKPECARLFDDEIRHPWQKVAA